MAYMKCSGGSGVLKETILWENPSKSSNFSAQTVTLTNSIDNSYKYIGVYSKSEKSVDISEIVLTMWSLNDFRSSATGNGNWQLHFHGYQLSSGGNYSRFIAYKTDSSVYISKCDRWGYGAAERAQAMIPIYVVGLK